MPLNCLLICFLSSYTISVLSFYTSQDFLGQRSVFGARKKCRCAGQREGCAQAAVRSRAGSCRLTKKSIYCGRRKAEVLRMCLELPGGRALPGEGCMCAGSVSAPGTGGLSDSVTLWELEGM